MNRLGYAILSVIALVGAGCSEGSRGNRADTSPADMPHTPVNTPVKKCSLIPVDGAGQHAAFAGNYYIFVTSTYNSELTDAGGRLYLTINDGTTAIELLESEAESEMLAKPDGQFFTASGNVAPSNMVVVDNILYLKDFFCIAQAAYSES